MTEMGEHTIDPEARALANEAIQLVKSGERLNAERWENNNKRFDEAGRTIWRQFDEVKTRLNNLDASMTAGFNTVTIKLEGIDRLYNSRWWSLAVILITTLLAISGGLALKAIVFHGP
jgi:hypothetical protein